MFAGSISFIICMIKLNDDYRRLIVGSYFVFLIHSPKLKTLHMDFLCMRKRDKYLQMHKGKFNHL